MKADNVTKKVFYVENSDIFAFSGGAITKLEIRGNNGEAIELIMDLQTFYYLQQKMKRFLHADRSRKQMIKMWKGRRKEDGN